MNYKETQEKLSKAMKPYNWEIATATEPDEDGYCDIVLMNKYSHNCVVIKSGDKDNFGAHCYNIVTCQISPSLLLDILKAIDYPINDD